MYRLRKSYKTTVFSFWMALWRNVISLPLIHPVWFPFTLSLSLSFIKVMERSYESQGRWSAVSCCHWPRTRRICRDRQYAHAGQKLIPWIIKDREKSMEDVALLRRGKQRILTSPGACRFLWGLLQHQLLNTDLIFLRNAINFSGSTMRSVLFDVSFKYNFKY